MKMSKRVRVIAVKDINGDGKAEVVAKEGGPRLVGYELDGPVVWEAALGGNPPRFGAGDLDGDGKNESAYTPPDGGLRVLSPDGSTRFELPTKVGNLQFADLDGDGNDEVLVETRGRPSSFLLCIGGDGELRWRFPTRGSYGSRFSVTPASGRGRRRFVVVYIPGVVLSGKGKVISTIGTARFAKALAPDLNGDGKKQLVSISPTIRAYDVASNRGLWGGTIPTSFPWWLTGNATIDVDGDGSQELVFTSAGHICIMSGSGELVRGKYVGEYGRRPNVGRIDVEGDGKDEILFVDARRFLVLDENLEVVAAALHPPFDDEEIPVVLSAHVDSFPGDEILVCRDPYQILAYSTKGQVVRTFRRPSWLPLHRWYQNYVWPKILPPMDVDGDGEKELAVLSDRLFVWNLRGELLDTGLNDYPRRNEVFGSLLVPRLKALVKYVKEFGAHGSISHYLKEAEKEFEMELYCAACPVEVGNGSAFGVSVFGLLKLIRTDGRVLWEVREKDAELYNIGFGDFDGDGEKEIVARAWKHVRSGRGPRTALLTYSLQGNRLAEIELEGWSFAGPVFADFDGDGSMEVAVGHDAGIAILDMTP